MEAPAQRGPVLLLAGAGAPSLRRLRVEEQKGLRGQHRLLAHLRHLAVAEPVPARGAARRAAERARVGNVVAVAVGA
eukprot:4478646-Prymnesium_polylepis.1